MLHPKIGDLWLTDVTSFGEVSYSENRLHGCELARWAMPPRTRHRNLVPGTKVVIHEGLVPVWTGYLTEPGRDGTFAATGWHALGRGVLALDGSGNPTNVPNDALNHAINTRGAVPWSYTAFPTGAVGEAAAGRTLVDLLDQMSADQNLPWRVDHYGRAVTAAAPAAPAWALHVSDDLWSTTLGDYVTHLNVTYMSGAGTYATFIRTTGASDAAASRFGRVEDNLDLTDHGIITLGAAQAAADAVLAARGPVLSINEALSCAPGQLRTLAGQRAGWAGVHAGQSVRLWGSPDRTRVDATAMHTDVVIDSVNRDRADTLTLTPVGANPKNSVDVVAEIVARVLA